MAGRQTITSLQSGIYLFPEFMPDALCCFSTRAFEASKDIPIFLNSIGAPGNQFATVEQIHGDQVVEITKENLGLPQEADGLVTDEKDLALVIRTADCLSVFIFDPDRPAIGLCHAGWRGAKKGIVFRTLETMGRFFESKPRFLKAGLGPAICPECYEVGEEFKSYFPGFVQTGGAKQFFDLRGAVKKQLVEAGVRHENILDSLLCTSCSVDQFYSARKEGIQTGRLISAAVLK